MEISLDIQQIKIKKFPFMKLLTSWQQNSAYLPRRGNKNTLPYLAPSLTHFQDTPFSPTASTHKF